MGGNESSAATLPQSFTSLLNTDIQLNDQICTDILTQQILSHQVLSTSIISDLISKKPNNIQVLIYHMIFSIYKMSKTLKSSGFSRSLLISCYNSYLLLQHFHSFCIDSWFCWSPPSQIPENLPSTFFVSSLNLLNHPLIQNSNENNSIYFLLKYEMFSCIILFLLSKPQPSSDHFPNLHFECLDEADPFPLFQHIITVDYQKLGNNSSQRWASTQFSASDSGITINELTRISLIVAASGLAYCPNWQSAFASLNFSTILPIFRVLLRPPDSNQLTLRFTSSPGVYLELLAFFYQTLLRHDEGLDSLISMGKEFIVSLLLSLELMKEYFFSYSHSIIFSTLVLLTSEPKICQKLNDPFTSPFPSKLSIHRGTYADLLVEIITDVVCFVDIELKSPLFTATCCILSNVSSHISCFSNFSCHCIFRFLQVMTESNYFLVPTLIPIIISIFEQVLCAQFDKNTNLMIFLMRNMKLFKQLKQRGFDIKYIENFAKCFKDMAKAKKQAKMGADEAEIVLKKLKPIMFMKLYELPGPRTHVFAGEMAELWIDWMATISMRSGTFLCLQFPSVM